MYRRKLVESDIYSVCAMAGHIYASISACGAFLMILGLLKKEEEKIRISKKKSVKTAFVTLMLAVAINGPA